jgi:hypothetical protein
MLVFPEALAPCFFLLVRGVGVRGSASTQAGTTFPPIGCRALAFEEK